MGRLLEHRGEYGVAGVNEIERLGRSGRSTSWDRKERVWYRRWRLLRLKTERIGGTIPMVSVEMGLS
jgi:hypothetical protein